MAANPRSPMEVLALENTIMQGGSSAYQGIMDMYGPFLLGSAQQQGVVVPTVPVHTELDDFTVNLSQGSPQTYTQMMQNIHAMGSQPSIPIEELFGGFSHMLQEPMGAENKMFMISGRTEEPNHEDNENEAETYEEYGYTDYTAYRTGEDEVAEENRYETAADEDEYEYTEDIANGEGPTESGCNDPNQHEERAPEPNTNQDNETTVQELSQEDIEIYIENESIVAAQTCSQEVRSHHVPHVNMVFETEIEAYKFYNQYASILGFSAKRAGNYHCRKQGNTDATRYTYRCNRSGKVLDKETMEERKKKKEEKRKKKEDATQVTRVARKRKRNTIEITDCQAKMVVTLKEEKWFVTTLDMQHNHELSPPGEARFLRSHKHMTDEEKLFIRTFNSVKLPTRKIMAILSYLRGGLSAVPYTKKDVSNLRTAIRKESNQNDMMQVLDYFRKRQSEDPRFYYAFKVDSENTVENIFWADGNSRRLYGMCGDCISFDTTYKTNKYNLPFAPFVGITGHGDNCLFGCAILHNETIGTFTWLFETFLHCMGGKAPVTIITDQDVAMKQAIPAVFKHTRHRNCLFHIKKKAEEKCARCFATKPNLHTEFSDIVNNSLTETEFETLWNQMIHKYEVQHIKYFEDMWNSRQRFVPVYFKKDFFPFIHSTARSEGTNAIFKDNVGSTYSVISFLSEYQRISETIEENEKEQDTITRITSPTYWGDYGFEEQAGARYNRKLFYRFQEQIKLTTKLHVEEKEQNAKYEVFKSRIHAVREFRPRRFIVLVDIGNEDYSCICAKFQKDGILCSHVLKVLVHLNISELPEKYFIDRWRPREKKDIRDIQYNVPLELTSHSSQLRFNILSRRLIDLASDGSKSNERYLFLVNEIKKLEEKLDEMTITDDQNHMKGGESVEHADCFGGQPAEQNCPIQLNDPKVAISKGRPQVVGRQKTLMEDIFTKQRITCGHCGSHEHNIATCTNLHLDKLIFQKKKRANKKTTACDKEGEKTKVQCAEPKRTSKMSKMKK